VPRLLEESQEVRRASWLFVHPSFLVLSSAAAAGAFGRIIFLVN